MHRGMPRAKSLSRISLFQHNCKKKEPFSEHDLPVKKCLITSYYCSLLIYNLVEMNSLLIKKLNKALEVKNT